MKKTWSLILCIVLAAALSIGGTMAFLQDVDSDVNVMTLGSVIIEQIEQQHAITDADRAEDTDGDGLVTFKNDKPLYPSVYLGYTKDTLPMENDFYTSAVSNAVDKIVSVKNTGKSEAWVRTWFAFEQGTMAADRFAELMIINRNVTDWAWSAPAYNVTVNIDGADKTCVVYSAVYNQPLAAGATTPVSLRQVLLSNAATNADVDALNIGGAYSIKVVSQAVQTAGFDTAAEALTAGLGDAFPGAVEGEVNTPAATADPTTVPTATATAEVTEKPTEKPTEVPTEEPTEKPTEVPTEEPTATPTTAPTATPTTAPTATPTTAPTATPEPTPEQPEATMISTVAELETALQTEGSYKLANNITWAPAGPFNVTQNVTLDLNGQQLTLTNKGRLAIKNNYALTIQDSVGGGVMYSAANGESGYGNSLFELLGNGSVLTINSGNITGSIWGTMGTVNIHGGQLTGMIRAVAEDKRTTINITGGTFIARGSSTIPYNIEASYSNVTISGGTFVTDTGSNASIYADGTINMVLKNHPTFETVGEYDIHLRQSNNRINFGGLENITQIYTVRYNGKDYQTIVKDSLMETEHYTAQATVSNFTTITISPNQE